MLPTRDPCREHLSELTGEPANTGYERDHSAWQVTSNANECHQRAHNVPRPDVCSAITKHAATELSRQKPQS